MMVGGIPVWRLPREVTREECDEYLEALGIEVKLNTTVGKDVQLTDLLDQYDAVYIGAGCMLSNPMTGPDNKVVPGADLQGVVPGLPFLEKVNFGEPVFVGKRVAVLGGGFTAMDCCRSSIRFGAEKVYVLYRRSKEEMPSDEYEVDEAIAGARRVHLSLASQGRSAQRGRRPRQSGAEDGPQPPRRSRRQRPSPRDRRARLGVRRSSATR